MNSDPVLRRPERPVRGVPGVDSPAALAEARGGIVEDMGWVV